jgi:tetratricopeptide (TPR) repeat protein
VQAAETEADEETLYREMVKRFPDEPKYAVRLGATLVNRGKDAPAREVLEPMAKKGKPAVRALANYHLARNALRQKPPQRALRHLDVAEKADADAVNTVAVLTFRGTVCERLGKPDDAIKAYRRGCDSTPNRRSCWQPSSACTSPRTAATRRADYLRRYTLVVSNNAAGLGGRGMAPEAGALRGRL